jgi:hypothetical protein
MPGIHDHFSDWFVATMTTELITNQSNVDLRPTLIRSGLLQQDPTKARIYLLITPGDQEDLQNSPKWADTPTGDQKEPGWGIPSNMVGGGQFWWRRFTVEIGLYLNRSKEDRSEAESVASSLLSRTIQACRDNQYPGIGPDSYGELPIEWHVSKSVTVESGGPPGSFIWRHKLYIAVLTERP